MRLVPLSIILLVACASFAQDSTIYKPAIDDNRIVVLKSKEFGQVATLDNSELKAIEEILQNSVNKYNVSLDSASYYFLNLENYFRQYVPYIKDGNKVVWANFFCKEQLGKFSDWEKEPVIVFDGGKCFFQLQINLTKKECSKIYVNGSSFKRELR